MEENNEKEEIATNRHKSPSKRGLHLTSEKAKEIRAKQGPRPKGKKTVLLEEAYKNIQEKIIERSLGLINTQTIIAHGTIKIYKIVTKEIGKGKAKRTIRERPVLVTDDEEIAQVLDWEYGSGDENPNDDTDFYFVSTQDPDNRAIKDQLDRIGLKAPDKLDLTSKGKEIHQITGMEIIREKKKNENPV